jgi:hypothetical protein
MPKRPRSSEAVPPSGTLLKAHAQKTADKGEEKKLASLSFDALLATKFADKDDDKYVPLGASGTVEKERKGLTAKEAQKSQKGPRFVARASNTTKRASGGKAKDKTSDEEPEAADAETNDAATDSDSDDDSDDDLPDMETFQKQLAGVKDADPAFFAFLQKNDKELVEAADGEGSSSEGEGEDSDEGEGDSDEQELSDEAELDAAAEYDQEEEQRNEKNERRNDRRDNSKEADSDSDASSVLDGAVEGPPMLTSAMAKSILESAFEAYSFRGELSEDMTCRGYKSFIEFLFFTLWFFIFPCRSC